MLSRGHEELASNVTNQGLSLRARLYAILRQADVSAGARQWRKFDLTVIVIGLLTVALATVDDLPPLTHRILIAVIMLLSALFFLEYLVRLWVAPEALSETARSPAGARLRWALSIKGLIGLLCSHTSGLHRHWRGRCGHGRSERVWSNVDSEARPARPSDGHACAGCFQ